MTDERHVTTTATPIQTVVVAPLASRIRQPAAPSDAQPATETVSDWTIHPDERPFMATNPRAIADTNTFTVRRTIQIAAPPDKVWTAVTEPEHLSRWLGRTVLVADGVGAHGTVTWPGENAVPIRIEAIDPPHSISYRWCNDTTVRTTDAGIDEAASTIFTFTLEPTEVGTQLTVEETGFETSANPAANLESHREGWDVELDELVALFEDGSS